MKAYTEECNVPMAVSHEPVTSGSGSDNARCEPYARELSKPQSGGNDNAAAIEGLQTKRTHIKHLIATAAAANGVTYEAIMSRARPRDICRARFDAIAAVAAAYPDMSFPRIGKIFNRDHSSIVHALMMRGVQPRSGRIQEYRKFAALMARKVGAEVPTEGEANHENS
jgi:hypothetical protein